MVLRYTEYFLIYFTTVKIASSSYGSSFNFETITNVMPHAVVVDTCFALVFPEIYERQPSTKHKYDEWV